MNLDELRIEIDQVDDQIAALLTRRMELSVKVAHAKADSRGPVYRPEREQAILARLCGAHPDWHAALASIYAAIFLASRAVQQKIMGGDA